MLYSFFWVIPLPLNFICQCFETLCSIFIGGIIKNNNYRPPLEVFALQLLFLYSGPTSPRPPPPPDWLRLFLSHTFSCINTSATSPRSFFLFIPPMKIFFSSGPRAYAPDAPQPVGLLCYPSVLDVPNFAASPSPRPCYPRDPWQRKVELRGRES
jgi:hypothetical protein